MAEKFNNSSLDLLDNNSSPEDKDYFNNYEHLPLTESAKVAKHALDNLETKSLDVELHPKETITGDSYHVEGQLLSFIKTNHGTELTFKLTANTYDEISETIATLPGVTSEKFNYFAKSKANGDEIVIPTIDATFLSVNGLDIVMAEQSQDWRAINSAVSIALPEVDTNGATPTNEELAKRLDDVMTNVLGIQEAFTNPDQGAEEEYIHKRVKWHHRLDDIDEARAHIPERRERPEVFPGYNTVVVPGQHLEYEKEYGEFGILHRVADKSVLPKILTNGLMSTNERFKRGVKTLGISSLLDIRTGGADNVFVRTITEESVSDKRNDSSIYENEILIAIKPEVTDRTDWYTYDDDMKGSTDPDDFNERITPNQLFRYLNSTGFKNMCNNEQMYRTGIATESIAGVAVHNPTTKRAVVLQLQMAGIEEVNGILVEDFVHVAENVSQIIDISNGRPPRQGNEHYLGQEHDSWKEVASPDPYEYDLGKNSQIFEVVK